MLRFDDRVVIVTGAGNGLGRSHAKLFAGAGAKVVVNDLGGGATGSGKGSEAADRVVAEIHEAGGEAVANYDSVEDGARIVEQALDHFGRVDVVVNNAGILRDVSFHKMTEEDWSLIYRVHLLGAYRITRAAWPHMRGQGYGRVVMTASAAGIYGNFGQANYGMAKLGLAGFANTLAVEGGTKNLQVNTIAPIAGSRLTETVLPQALTDALKAEYVSPLVAWLCHEDCEENGGLFEVGGGYFGKLRWERAAGRTFRLGRAMTIESIQKSWDEVTSFEETTHPQDIRQSMAPILENIQAGPSRGGNEHIDVDLALGYEHPERETRYDERDVALYALGVGAATDPLNDADLQLVYELHGNGLRVLPTFGVVPVVNMMLQAAREGARVPGMNWGMERVLHGEQYTRLARPLPPKAKLTHRSKVSEIWDKGKGAVVITETQTFDEDGDLLVVNETTLFVRGAGGWGGERGPSAELNVPPERAPDAVVEEQIAANQSLVYRLSGDWNPLHADPAFAQAFGYERPILHGLCTFGHAARHVVNTFSGGDVRFFKSIKVRFADSVFPGETLITEMWKESDTRVVFRCSVRERDKAVITNAAIELYTEIPKKAEKAAAPAEAAASGGSAEPISADIFAGMRAHVSAHPELAEKIGQVFQFRLGDPDSVWTLDLKQSAVTEGEAAKADCTLELSDADFMGMCTGKLKAQKLYFSGRLKISGDVMASQKLDFLQKIDPQHVLDAAKARGGGAPTEAPAAPAGPTSGDVFLGIGAYVAAHPELNEIGVVYLFELTDPASTWTLDLKQGALSAGRVGKAGCTLTLSDADFMLMTKGEIDPQKLYFSGRLKVAGDVMASQKLDFLQKVDPAEVAEAVAAAKASGAAEAAPAAAAEPGRTPVAGTLFERLAAHLRETPGLAAEVGARVQFHVTGPDAAWGLDLRDGVAIAAGTLDDADSVLTLSDEDLEAWAADEVKPYDLFLRGRLRVDGDVRVVQRMGFIAGIGAGQ